MPPERSPLTGGHGACTLCDTAPLTVAYSGRIRSGAFGHLSEEDRVVLACAGCGAKRLAAPPPDATFYEGRAYRDEYDGAQDLATFHRLHDAEQLRNVSATGIELYRDRVVADVGCGGGSFLDAIRGLAREVIAIEPSQDFRRGLAERGMRAYGYVSEALREHEGAVDVVVSFSVIEHIDEPVAFLAETRRLLKTGGKLVLSTPNADDALLAALGDRYAQFFYRTAHRWYFDPTSLRDLLLRAGYRDPSVVTHQRFGLANFLTWLRDGRPSGDARYEFVTPAVDAVWRAELQRIGRADYLYAFADA